MQSEGGWEHVRPGVRRMAAAFLSSPAGAIVSQQALIESAVVRKEIHKNKIIHVYIHYLRRMLANTGCEGDTILCVHGRGYILNPDCRRQLAALVQGARKW